MNLTALNSRPEIKENSKLHKNYVQFDKLIKIISNRKLPIEISRGFIDNDEFEIELPDTYKIDALADNVTIENKFGAYKFSIEKISENTLKYSRMFFLKKGSYPKEDYNDYRDFRKKIAKYDKTKVVLIKN